MAPEKTASPTWITVDPALLTTSTGQSLAPRSASLARTILLSSFKELSSYLEETQSGSRATSNPTPQRQESGTPSGPESTSTLLGTHSEDAQTAYLTYLHKTNLWSSNQQSNPTFQIPSNLGYHHLSLNEHDQREATEHLKATKNQRKRKPTRKSTTPSLNPKKKAKSSSTNPRPLTTKEPKSRSQCR